MVFVKSRYIEHHFEVRAKLPPIFDVYVTAFCFAVYNGMTVQMGYDFAMTSFLQKASKTTPLKKRQERHSERTAHLVCNAFRVGMRLPQGLSDLYISFCMVLYGRPDFERIMRYMVLYVQRA